MVEGKEEESKTETNSQLTEEQVQEYFILKQKAENKLPNTRQELIEHMKELRLNIGKMLSQSKGKDYHNYLECYNAIVDFQTVLKWLDNQLQYIEKLKNQIQPLNEQIEQLKKENERLSQKNLDADKERERLERLEKELGNVDSLKKEIENLKSQLKDFDKFKEQYKELEKKANEYYNSWLNQYQSNQSLSEELKKRKHRLF